MPFPPPPFLLHSLSMQPTVSLPLKPFILSYFFPLFLTSSTLKYSTKQCSSHRFLRDLCATLRSMRRKAMMEEDRRCKKKKNAKRPVFTSICLTLNPHGGYLITDSCSESRPRGSAKVKPAFVQGQEVIQMPPVQFLFSQINVPCYSALECSAQVIKQINLKRVQIKRYKKEESVRDILHSLVYVYIYVPSEEILEKQRHE